MGQVAQVLGSKSQNATSNRNEDTSEGKVLKLNPTAQSSLKGAQMYSDPEKESVADESNCLLLASFSMSRGRMH